VAAFIVKPLDQTPDIPNMKSKKTHWRVLALVTFVALLLATFVLPPLAKSWWQN
jgi:hypothetical protein